MPSIVQALPTYGRDLLSALPGEAFEDCVVLCAPEAWELARGRFPKKPRAVDVPAAMERGVLEAQLDRLPAAHGVFGIGGGSACDAAKMHAWRTGARLILVPSILSVDAPFTKAVGVRVGHRVRYVGEVFPERLLVDFDLLQKAPAKLNRAGIGDILSIFTALFDWRLAHEIKGEPFDPDVAMASQILYSRMVQGAEEIAECTEEGLKLISELFVGEVGLCEIMRNSRPEEGSEHYFAYALESLTRKSYIHGELIACAVLLTALAQEQPVEEILDFLKRVKVDFRPSRIGVAIEELKRTLFTLPAYLAEETQLPYGIWHHKRFDESAAENLIGRFLSAIDK